MEQRPKQSRRIERGMTAIGLTTMATETAENRSIANICIELEGKLSTDEVRQLLEDPEKGFTRNFRFRSKVVGSKFVEILDFAASSVISEFTIPVEPAGHERWMVDRIGMKGTEPLNGGNEELPLWECRVMHGYKGSSTLLHIRFHHCMVDGASLITLFFGLSDEAEQMAQRNKKPEQKNPRWSAQACLRSVIRFFTVTILALVHVIIGAALVLLKHARGLCRGKAGSPFKGPLGIPKSLSMCSKEYDLAQVKDAGKRRGKFTINDVMLSAFVGALRSWLEAKKGPAAVRPGAIVTCALPKDLRKGGDHYIGNKIGAFTVDLPVGEADRELRLKKTAAVMSVAKSSPEAELGYLLGKLAYVLPRWGSKLVMGKMTSGVECVFTNVRGVDADIHILGHRLGKTLGFVPPPPGVGLGMACGSFFGKVFFSISADRTLLGDASSEMVGLFEKELQALIGDAK